ncbi:hypothetical protein [Mucilaginibacter sp.]|uniref:hypothetical protein n=1 Tax=Mucilaginibacter sp. TaxID=1882438 RepID=UPI0025F112E4|nr:hypothetical protein [Mucilaginibacter sp.]
MECLVLNPQSKNQPTDYIADNYLMPYESGIFKEMLQAIETGDQTQLDWFRSFGDSFRTITMNVYAYRKGLEFGFTDISLDKNGWLIRPQFPDKEELTFGDTSRYGNHSLIYLGRGEKHTWTYGMNYSYGVAGGCYGLSVYGKQFKSRQDALTFALNELKVMMTKKIDSTDTTNDKQPVILATLRDIEKAQVGMVQLSLF